METRKITVIDTRVNRTQTFESAAETMAEMLADFRANGINANGMAIQEGLTKTELNENSVLPHDVPYRGTVTNNLVFRLTQKAKNIASGMDRKAVYITIKTMGLENAVKERYGKNYTQVPTIDLEKVIEESTPCCPKEMDTIEQKHYETVNAIMTLLHTLYDYDFIDFDDVEEIANILKVEIVNKEGEKNNKGVYSASELNEMFEGMD